MKSNWQDLLTWWETADGGVRVECYRDSPGSFGVRTLRGGHESGLWTADREAGARKIFESVVETLAAEEWRRVRLPELLDDERN